MFISLSPEILTENNKYKQVLTKTFQTKNVTEFEVQAPWF